MSNKTNPPSFVMTGYMLEKSARYFTAYALKALNCTETSIKAARANGDNVTMADIADWRGRILGAINAVQDMYRIHGEMAEFAIDHGYPPVTDAELAELGAGGHK